MAVHRNQAKEFVGKAMRPDVHGDFLAGINLIDTLERFGIARPLDGIDMRLQAPTIKPMDAMRRHERTFGIRQLWISRREYIGKDGHQIEAQHDQTSGHGKMMLAEAPPHQLPL